MRKVNGISGSSVALATTGDPTKSDQDAASIEALASRPLPARSKPSAVPSDPQGARQSAAAQQSAGMQAKRAEPGLGNIAGSDFAITEQAQAKRKKRYDLRNRGRDLALTVMGCRADPAYATWTEESGWGLRSHRAAHCAAMPRHGGQLIFRQDAQSAGLAGLQHCGTMACPVCAAKIGQRRTQEVARVLTQARADGHALAMVTLTMRHNGGHELAMLWDALGEAWREITTAKSWTGESVQAYDGRLVNWFLRGQDHDEGLRLRAQADDPRSVVVPRAPRGWAAGKVPTRTVGVTERLGVIGMMRATELTRSQRGAGWHVHVHGLVVLEGRGETRFDQEVRAMEVGAEMHKLWEKGLNARGLESWSEHGGLDVTPLASTSEAIATYVTKLADASGLTEHEAKREVMDGVKKSVSGLSLETTRGDLKTGREARGLTPFELMERAVDGDVEARELWVEYLEASQGRRILVIPPGLRELADLGEEISDEEIANEEQHGANVVRISTNDFYDYQLWIDLADLLTILETRGVDALLDDLRRRGAVPLDLREIDDPVPT